ncbi:Efflux pump membrane transporter BepE [bioreactor metagenome]|uniref:Efflux pump membrane transporter BepE n=1 Tax=bioreactor metagenome TaxID=1076179 RepID=A0A644UCV2_9ZZZZ|nr:efflux RND transporter permease subunit [Acidaminococcaceae bacterium]
MKSFNLTGWALKHKQLIYYFMAAIFLMGVYSYQNLGRMEDPDFVIRQMVVSAVWPGASAAQVEEQVTDKIEKKLQDTPGIDYISSYSKPGQAVIFVYLKETVPEKDVRPTWLEVRNLVNDMKSTLPTEVQGLYFNDRFDDVYGSIYALTSDGFSYEEMRSNAEKIRRELLTVKNVKKVELIGVQEEKVYVEIESSKLAQLGIDPALIASTISGQNAMTPSGMLETSQDNVYLRFSGMFKNLEDLKKIPIRANGRTFALEDIANIKSGYSDPKEPQMYYNGQPAIGIALSMDKGGNILQLGDDLDSKVAQIEKELPYGLQLDQVSNQPKVVKESIHEFVKSLFEAVVIVLIVSFLSLGYRTGVVVALSIPLVIAGVFAAMYGLGIGLHKVSLGALIISLGLLVDDAIISVEMMSVKIEEGWERSKAACFAYTATSFPMLTGTLVTCAGFIPIGFSKGNAAEFTNSIFVVVSIALLISWLVSVLVVPLLGILLMKPKIVVENHDPYDKKFYKVFKKLLSWCLRKRKLVLLITVACFAGAIVLMSFVKSEFFPPSTRPELIAEMTLPRGASIKATAEQAQRMSDYLKDDPDIVNYSYYVGEGSPRFVLTLEPVLPMDNYCQFVITTKNVAARQRLDNKINQLFNDEFENVQGFTKVIQTGPPVAYPVMIRVSGDDHNKVRALAKEVGRVMSENPQLKNINYDWNEMSKVMHLDIDQGKARMLGIDSHSLALDLQTQLSGAPLAEFRQADRTIDITFRLDAQNRKDLASIKDMPVHIGNGKYVPLAQIANISYAGEDGLIWRRNLKPTITVRADVNGTITGNDATAKIYDELQNLKASMPPGYTIEPGGYMEKSVQSTALLMQPVPIMIIVIITLLMVQLQKVSLAMLAALTAPLGMIGVSISLLLTQRPLGFVAELGILALSGMIIRNSVILIDQIEQHMKEGQSPWNAIINSAVLRLRPIMLTAAAAILGMLPLIASPFWGPMAVAIAGGLLIATFLTLFVLPAMYAMWFKVKEEN